MATRVGDWGAGAVWRVTSGVFPSNAYFCEADVPGGGILVDPGLDSQAIDAELSALGLRPHQVFCTHGHFDHTGGAAWFRERYDCEVFLHRADSRTMRSSNFLLMALQIPHRVQAADVTWVDDDFCTDIAGRRLRFLPAPGHTPGSCVLELGSAWFTGDTLYSRGVGLNSLPGEDRDALRTTIRGLWPRLTAERMVYPGHGDPADGETVRTGNHALTAFLGTVDA
ncbi:MBL fold metallo-hydrolase [Modestobacter sp. VKM Ac-2985]|uniref:MBL fold metallo-hydrolase n=1 Tax=Modestobacter sp. VKM Ac-2985 TaxID=3004139 RepID=UPI0022AB7A28|nr:MBL fold metallo-hydrolase [Modestobacter sp. VKM Ac-2985]MCZ2836537.1 MBL fold metallo-hydrolase [Modestobacter sp. VKM Ac-2985]